MLSQEAMNLAASRAATFIKKGFSRRSLFEILSEMGHDPSDAKQIIHRAVQMVRMTLWRNAGITIAKGATVCVVGILCSWWNYSSARPGNHYWVFTGGILLGAWYVIVGVYKITAFELLMAFR
jgi:hypothetical protein